MSYFPGEKQIVYNNIVLIYIVRWKGSMAVIKVLFCVYICLFELRNSLQDVVYKMVVYRINQWAL